MEKDNNYFKAENGKPIKPRRRIKANPVMKCFKKLFSKLYPAKMKPTWTK